MVILIARFLSSVFKWKILTDPSALVVISLPSYQPQAKSILKMKQLKQLTSDFNL
jgi:hypothetical protein